MPRHPSMKYDPNLRTAMQAIKAILKSYDITAHVVLVSQTHSEFLFSPEASWSCCTVTPEGVRIRSTHLPAAQKAEAVEATTHMVLSTRDLLVNGQTYYEGMAAALASQFEIDHRSLVDLKPDSMAPSLKDPEAH